MRKPSLLLVVAATFVTAYTALSAWNFRTFCVEQLEEESARLEGAIASFSEAATAMLAEGRAADAERLLRTARARSLIHFYIAQKQGGPPAFFGVAGDDPAPLDVRYQRFDELLRYPKVIFLTRRAGPYTLTAGVNLDRDALLLAAGRAHLGMLLKDILLVLGLAVAAVAFGARDFLRLAGKLSQARGGRISESDARTQEAQILARSLATYEDRVSRLDRSNRALSRQLPSVFLQELAAGRKLPPAFECAMVRTDVNQYSTILQQHPPGPFGEMLRDFFLGCDRIIRRCDGSVFKLLGDEVVYFFRDGPASSAAERALAAATEIGALADRIHRERALAQGYPFRVKSALACGEIKCITVLGANDFEGRVLVETKRLLDQVTDRSVNTLICSAEARGRLGDAAESRALGARELKGLPGAVELFALERRRTLEEALARIEQGTAASVDAYRSDAEIRARLDFAARALTEGRAEAAFAAVATLRSCRVEEEIPELRVAYSQLLRRLAAAAAAAGAAEVDTPAHRFLSAAVMIGPAIIPAGGADEALEAALTDLLASPDPRVVANAIEALAHFGVEAKGSLFADLVRHRSNRVQANAIIREGRRELNDAVLGALRGMLDSGDPFRVSSALFALGELGRHWRAENPVYLSIRLGFQSLAQRVPALLGHADPMVARQAAGAAAKLELAEAEAAPPAAAASGGPRA